MNNKQALTLGADPEFGIVDLARQRLTPAGEFFHNMKYIGVDGAGVLGELRPRESNHILELLDCIIASMRCVCTMVDTRYPIVAGAMYNGLGIGGHIHFGLKADQEAMIKYTNVLDYVFESLSIAIEPRNDIQKRRNAGYGKLGSYRTQPWGWEYRMPLSWLLSPEVAAVYLSMAKIAIVATHDRVPVTTYKKKYGLGMHFLRELLKNAAIPEDCLFGAYALLEISKNVPLILSQWKNDCRKNWERPNA